MRAAPGIERCRTRWGAACVASKQRAALHAVAQDNGDAARHRHDGAEHTSAAADQIDHGAERKLEVLTSIRQGGFAKNTQTQGGKVR
jgi:hypothetical protein